MSRINIEEVKHFVEQNINRFHQDRLRCLEQTRLPDLLKKKNPYLFKAKNLLTAQDLINSCLDAMLSSSEEKIFGGFLEELAIYVAQKTLNARKSSSRGVDFEYVKNNVHYLVSVKSGTSWGNSSQWNSLENDLKQARRVLMQSRSVKNVETVLGICYGKTKTTLKRGIIKQVTGQNFWYMVSGNERFYTEIVEPLGHKARELNNEFKQKKAQIINKFTKQFVEDFCDKDGAILWEKLVKFNSGNLTGEDKSDLW